jgi:hypothetical protein
MKLVSTITITLESWTLEERDIKNSAMDCSSAVVSVGGHDTSIKTSLPVSVARRWTSVAGIWLKLG